jgi:hypothetical protein
MPGSVKWVKCPNTGKSEDPFRIWLCPKNVKITDNVDDTGSIIRLDGEADEGDLQSWSGAGSGAKPPLVPIKLEKKSREEVLAEQREKS